MKNLRDAQALLETMAAVIKTCQNNAAQRAGEALLNATDDGPGGGKLAIAMLEGAKMHGMLDLAGELLDPVLKAKQAIQQAMDEAHALRELEEIQWGDPPMTRFVLKADLSGPPADHVPVWSIKGVEVGSVPRWKACQLVGYLVEIDHAEMDERFDVAENVGPDLSEKEPIACTPAGTRNVETDMPKGWDIPSTPRRSVTARLTLDGLTFLREPMWFRPYTFHPGECWALLRPGDRSAGSISRGLTDHDTADIWIDIEPETPGPIHSFAAEVRAIDLRTGSLKVLLPPTAAREMKRNTMPVSGAEGSQEAAQEPTADE